MILRIVALSIVGLATANSLYGGNTGGGGPPSIQDQMDMLRSVESPAASLISLESGDLMLGTNQELSQELKVSRDAPAPAAKVSEADFIALNKAVSQYIDVTAINPDTLSPVTKSYRIEDGDVVGELVLKDRLQLMRKSITH